MSDPAPSVANAFSVGAATTATFPTATQWLSFTNGGSGSITITTLGGQSVAVALPSGMYPIRAVAVTANTMTAVIGWW